MYPRDIYLTAEGKEQSETARDQGEARSRSFSSPREIETRRGPHYTRKSQRSRGRFCGFDLIDRAAISPGGAAAVLPSTGGQFFAGENEEVGGNRRSPLSNCEAAGYIRRFGAQFQPAIRDVERGDRRCSPQMRGSCIGRVAKATEARG